MIQVAYRLATVLFVRVAVLITHSKRAKTQALLDSGATKNFMTLDYAKSLHFPIKELNELRMLYNVDGTINKAGII